MMNTITYSQAYSHEPFTESIPASRPCQSSQDNPKPSGHTGERPALLRGIVESLIDGIMILTDQGELIFANSCAKRICRQLAQSFTRRNTAPHASAPQQAVPQQVWRSCQVLIKSREEFPTESIVIEDEIKTKEDVAIRLRARWLDLNDIERPYLLIALEDRQQSAQYQAIAEAQKYGLTDRETQVWLLKRAGHTYKAIASELHITEDTVKKHIKSIYAKREGAEWLGNS